MNQTAKSSDFIRYSFWGTFIDLKTLGLGPTFWPPNHPAAALELRWSVCCRNTRRGGQPALFLVEILCALQWREQLAGTFHLLHHLKRWHGFSSVSFSSLVPLALAEEPPAKFYYTLNKPAYSPVSRTHYGVSGLMGTVKHPFYHHSRDLTFLPDCHRSYMAGLRTWFNLRCDTMIVKKEIIYLF